MITTIFTKIGWFTNRFPFVTLVIMTAFVALCMGAFYTSQAFSVAAWLVASAFFLSIGFIFAVIGYALDR